MKGFVLIWGIINLLLFIGILIYFGINQSILKKKIKEIQKQTDEEILLYKAQAENQKMIYLENLAQEILRETDKTEKTIQDLTARRKEEEENFQKFIDELEKKRKDLK